MRRLAAVLCVLVALPVAAQSPGPLAEVGAALIAGDTSRAYRIARDESRLDRESAGLARARLRLEMAGYGTERLPLFARYEQITDVAYQLLRLSPGDTLALRALSVDALWTILSTHDKVSPTAIEGPSGGLALAAPSPVGEVGRGIGGATEFITTREVRGRTSTSRFDLGARDDVTPEIDASDRAQTARDRLRGHLALWRAATPDDPKPYVVGATVAALNEEWDEVLTTARAFRAARPKDAVPLLVLGLAHARLGNTDAAEVSFDEALARLPAALRARYDDLTPLLTPTQQAAYASNPQRFAEVYWAGADPRLLTTANERRAEHRARVVEADLLFTLDLTDFPRLFDLPVWPPRGVETEQGRIWVRYGRPLRTVQFTSRAGRFAPYGEGEKRFSVWEYPDFRYAFDDPERRGTYRKYSPPATAFSGQDASTAVNDDYVMQDRRLQRDDPARTQMTPTFALPLLASRFRRPDGRTEVVVAYGVPLADPAAIPEQVEAGVFSIGDGGVADANRRTVQPARGRVLTTREASVWPDAATVALPGTSSTVRAEVEVGEAWGAASTPLDPLPATGFGLSDVLLASAVEEGEGGPIVRDGLSITPVPWGVFAVGDPIYVYVETYGLTLVDGRTRYSVEARLVPEAKRDGLLGRILGRGQGPGVAVRNDPEGDRATESTAFFVDASRQEPGRYTLRIEVTDRVTGATASAERAVILE